MDFTAQKAKNENLRREEEKAKKMKRLPVCPAWWSDKKKREAVMAGTHRYA